MLKNSVLSKFTSMQDLENNNWIILGPLGSIEIQNYINFIITLLFLKKALWKPAVWIFPPLFGIETTKIKTVFLSNSR